MNTKSTQIYAGFFLDVGRYTFDYLFDNDKSEIRILLSSEQEKKIMKTLLSKCSIPTNGEDSNVVLISIEDYGLSATYVDEEYDLDFKDYIKMLYSYADKDDKKVSEFVEKRLFKESLDYGFRRIGLK